MKKKFSLETLKASFLAWALETAIGCTVFIIIFGNVFYPIYQGVSTGTWDQYSVLLWGFIGLVTLAAFMIRVIDSAKRGYTSLV
jgi:hypothetical protein